MSCDAKGSRKDMWTCPLFHHWTAFYSFLSIQFPIFPTVLSMLTKSNDKVGSQLKPQKSIVAQTRWYRGAKKSQNKHSGNQSHPPSNQGVWLTDGILFKLTHKWSHLLACCQDEEANWPPISRTTIILQRGLWFESFLVLKKVTLLMNPPIVLHI